MAVSRCVSLRFSQQNVAPIVVMLCMGIMEREAGCIRKSSMARSGQVVSVGVWCAEGVREGGRER